jgi:pyruvate formate lyase activating enzyme
MRKARAGGGRFMRDNAVQPDFGIVFDIQHYAVYDGPGIRTCIFFKGCPLRCAWCHNPESQKLKPEVSYFKDRCTACGACVEACPNRAIRLVKGRVSRDADRCSVCGACADACLSHATQIMGRRMTVDEIVETVARDKPFYDNSGGGVTISGGEATAQHEFLFSLLRALRDHEIHTALETCGFFRSDIIEDLCDLVNLFLFDFKHSDNDEHTRLTGVGNVSIIQNFRALLERAGAARVLPRVPLIPGANTHPQAIEGIIRILTSSGYRGAAHLMPYNSMARTKWEKIGRGREYTDFGALPPEDIDRISAQFAAAGFTTLVNH